MEKAYSYKDDRIICSSGMDQASFNNLTEHGNIEIIKIMPYGTSGSYFSLFYKKIKQTNLNENKVTI